VLQRDSELKVIKRARSVIWTSDRWQCSAWQ